MSFWVKKDAPFPECPEGTLRVYHHDDRDCWSVTYPGDKNYGTAQIMWKDAGGQIFDGKAWRPGVYL